ncbi:hypothetical protein O6H91_08G017000 [Diphasiastrum complanatum]|uniref:Uncharacterized protein n=1 Tax=Diphasiastrum complanatum TaxID=34168 RepID=A0ACC2CVC8_DIPCM|nr:hypothetical protein O6H91_08G017000 [Diphasiastrum complanatum]
MRLAYFLHNSQETALVNITLPPFEFGIKQVSYTTLVWHYFHKENEQSWSLNEKERINFCMNYSEVNYVMDLKSKGLKLKEETSEVAAKIRQEMQVHIIYLKSQRNASAHVFSTVVRQKTSAHHREVSHPKVRTLLDVAVPDLSFEYGRELLHLLQSLTTKPPEEFKSLHVCFPIQSRFLKFVLENRKYDHQGPAPNYPSLPQFP